MPTLAGKQRPVKMRFLALQYQLVSVALELCMLDVCVVLLIE